MATRPKHKHPKPYKRAPGEGMRADMLLVGLVSEMVRFFADNFPPVSDEATPAGLDMKYEALLYRTLEANCRVKAEMAEELAGAEKRKTKESKRSAAR